MENTDGQEMVRFHRETKKEEAKFVTNRQTDGQTDRQSQRQKITDS